MKKNITQVASNLVISILGLTKVITSPLIGGLVARSLLPWAILFPLVVDWIALLGVDLHLYSRNIGCTIQATLTIITFSLVVLKNARLLDHLEQERLRVTKALKESQEKLSQAIEIAKLGIWEWDIKTNQVFLSSQCEAVFELSLGSFAGTYEAFQAIVHPEDLQLVKESMAEAMTNGNEWEMEYRAVAPNGGKHWISSIGKFLYDETGQPVRMTGVAKNITHKKQLENQQEKINQKLELGVAKRTAQLAAVNEQLRLQIEKQQEIEKALRESQERLELALEASGDGLWDWNIVTKEAYYSDHYWAMLGYDPLELPANITTWENLVHPKDIVWAKETIKDDFNKNSKAYTFDYRLLTKSGEWKWIACYGKIVAWDEAGRPLRIAGTHQDVSNRKALEQELAMREAQLNAFFSTAPVGLAILDSQQRHLKINERLAQINGLSVEEHTGKTVREIVPDLADQIESMHQRVLVTGKPLINQEIIGQVSSQPGSIRYWTVSYFPIPDLEGNLFGFGSVVLEISDYKLLEANLRQAKEAAEKADRAKSQFLANISHEIRTPMNAILGFCDLLDSFVTESKPRSYLQAITVSGQTLLGLLEDILDLSKIEAGKLKLNYEPVNLRTLIFEIKHIFTPKATQKNLEIITEFDENLPKIVIFEQLRLRQILFNVVGNAIKFTQQGYIKISINCTISGTDRIKIVLAIKDTGIGIPNDEQAAIFEAFRQVEGQSNRRYGGTGLGLTIVKRLTEMLGGKINLQSQWGIGSTFTFIFSKVSIPEGISQQKTDLKLDTNFDRFKPAKILVVDDISFNLDLIRSYFAGTKHRILLAYDGLEAVAMARQHSVDLILLDLRLPNMDGYTAAQILKQEERTKHIPIVIVSASYTEKEQKSLQDLCEDYLLKPVSRQQLASVLAKILPLSETDSSLTEDINVTLLAEQAPYSQLPLADLKEKLLQKEQIVEQELAKFMIMRDLKNFSQTLQQWGQEYQSCVVSEYALKLMNEIEEFDLEAIQLTLKAFPEIKYKIE